MVFGSVELRFSKCTHNRSLMTACSAVDVGCVLAAAESRQLMPSTACTKAGVWKNGTRYRISGTVNLTICHNEKKKISEERTGVAKADYLNLDCGKSSSQISSTVLSREVRSYIFRLFLWRLCCYDEKAASHSEIHVGINDIPRSTVGVQKGQSQKQVIDGDIGVYTSVISPSSNSRGDSNSRLLDEHNRDGFENKSELDSPHKDEEGRSLLGLQERKISNFDREVQDGSSPKSHVDGTPDVKLSDTGVYQNLTEGRPKNLQDIQRAQKGGETYQKTGAGGSSYVGESILVGVKEPVYEVLEVTSNACVTRKEISRRQLLKTSGLRLRDIRSVDPSLWVTNSAPALLVRDHAILLNLGSLRAIVTRARVLIFDHKSIGAQNFLEALRQRLTIDNTGIPVMPFQLEAVEAALISRTQRLEQTLMQIEPKVVSLLEILPNRLTADVLEELRISKQALVELSSKAGLLTQMLLELLEHPHEIRRMTIIGRSCHIRKEDGATECLMPLDKQVAEDEEEEIEMLLENYLLRCESCHGQAQKLLDSAKEMEDSISVNLSARRLEVSRLELLLQVGTFCTAIGALIAGVFGMNLRSYLEENMLAFWITTAGILLGGLALFVLMYTYLRRRRIL